jgi:hypothetical protein
MELTVRLKRNPVLRPSKVKPVIKGHVIGINGEEGENIVRSGIRDIDEAKTSAREYLQRELGHLGAVNVTFFEGDV